MLQTLVLLLLLLFFCLTRLALDGRQCYWILQTTNDTDFLLLSSKEVSIFFNNTFVTKTTIANVSPGESFVTCLGVDQSVKVSLVKLVGHMIG